MLSMPVLSRKQVLRVLRAAIRDVDRKRLWASADGAKIRHIQSSPVNRKKFFTEPVVCRSAIPNDIFMVRHSWVSASLNLRDLLLLPEGLAVQFMVL